MTDAAPVFTPPTVAVIVEVPFHDVDSAQIAWHGHYAKYLEVARCALLDSFDYNYPQMCDSGYFWPVIDMHLRYVRPARFQQKLRVSATLKEWENRLMIGYLIEDIASGERMTKATTTQVAVTMSTNEMQLASPPVLLQKLGLEG
jgi:acyl-CoA thioester hydrolase